MYSFIFFNVSFLHFGRVALVVSGFFWYFKHGCTDDSRPDSFCEGRFEVTKSSLVLDFEVDTEFYPRWTSDILISPESLSCAQSSSVCMVSVRSGLTEF